MKKKKRILTYGTFDLFHIGHLRLLERCRAMGDELFVGVSTDSFNFKKGKSSIFSFEERLDIIASLKFVDFTFPEDSWDQKFSDIKKYSIDTFVMGSDWTGKFDFLKTEVDVVYLERTMGISSTEIRTKLEKIDENSVEKLREALDIIVQVLAVVK